MIKHGFTDKDNQITITEMMIVYTNQNDEFLKIETNDEGAGIFYTLTTEKWSFDNIQELNKVLDDFTSKVIENE